MMDSLKCVFAPKEIERERERESHDDDGATVIISLRPQFDIPRRYLKAIKTRLKQDNVCCCSVREEEDNKKKKHSTKKKMSVC